MTPSATYSDLLTRLYRYLGLQGRPTPDKAFESEGPTAAAPLPANVEDYAVPGKGVSMDVLHLSFERRGLVVPCKPTILLKTDRLTYENIAQVLSILMAPLPLGL